MRIALISAASENGIIGRDNDLPWHLPDDFRHFKRTTKGHHVIMGRRTWESRGGRALSRRTNVIVSAQPDYQAEGGHVVHSLEEGLALARANGEQEAFVIGGTRLYREALPLAQRIYLTRVHAIVDGDTRFPIIDPTLWTTVEAVHHNADERHAHGFTMLVLERCPDDQGAQGQG